ncbi:hypothetical protein [Caulobacter sp. SSI4214]|uniref:hypothetical protein n=1 Tax=Caulobacter sp. SSI4214 TaxID=2575739 RepID=UPI001439A460|nr:hypothetical protein [Caulobacter sp. SSI4214]
MINAAIALNSHAQLGEHKVPGPGYRGKEVNDSPRRTEPKRTEPHRNAIGESNPTTPPRPKPKSGRAPARVSASTDDVNEQLGIAYENLRQALTPLQREGMGIGAPSEHVSAKIIGGIDTLLRIGNFFIGAELAKNAYAQQELYRSKLSIKEKGYLLISHEGAGQTKATPVKSLDDKPLDWDPKRMVIVEVTGLDADSKALRDTMYNGLQRKYDDLEAERHRPSPGPPVRIEPPAPKPRPCSGKACSPRSER